MKALFTALFTSIVVFAASQEMDTILFSEVLILEDRIPAKISETARSVVVITADEIKKMNAVSLNEVLSFVAGVDVRQRGPLGVQADVGIRGGSFDQTLVLINGMKVSDPQTGHHAMNLPVALENIERIEVIKGPAARLYGPNAFAGAINIITKPGNENQVFVAVGYGENQLYSGNATVNLSGKKLKQTLSLSASGSDSFVYNTDFAIQNVFYQAAAKIKRTEIGLIAAANAKKFGANSFYSSTDFRDQYEETETYFGGVSASHTGEKGTVLRGKVYGRKHKDHYVFIRDNPSVYENFHTSNVLAAEFGAQKKIGLGNLNFGIDTRNEQLESSNLGNHERWVSSGFLDYRVVVGKLLINPGANVSLISDYDPQLFPGIDMSYELKKRLWLFGSYGTSFRVPTYTDLYYVGPQNIGNDQLTPETAWNLEMGVKKDGKFGRASATVFRKQAENGIEWVRSDDSAKWQARNLHQVTTFGLEASLLLKMGKLWSSQKVLEQLSLSYAHLNADFSVNQDFDSKYQIENIRHQVISSINHRLPFGFHHQLSARIIDRFHFDEAYAIVDSRIYRQTERYLLYVEVSNLANTVYRETNLVQMPGRWIRVGGRVNINF